MKQKKRKQAGITLVELLVAMLCATIAITMIVSTTLFITFTTDKLIKTGAESYRIQSIKDYILSQDHKTNPQAEYTVNEAENTISHNGTIIVRDTEISKIDFSEDENFIYCTLVFQQKSYRFIAGYKKGGST